MKFLVSTIVSLLFVSNSEAFVRNGGESRLVSTKLFGEKKYVLQDAFRTLTGKLSHSPEIVLPQPTDPTALLLLSNSITLLSEGLRKKAKASTAWISSSNLENVATFVNEQEDARGNFPGPLSVIYCGPATSGETAFSADDIAKTGVSGVVLPIEGVMNSADDDMSLDKYSEIFQTYISSNLEVIPEVTLGFDYAPECNVEELVDTITKDLCGSDEPAAILLSVNSGTIEGRRSDEDEDIVVVDDEKISLPSIPKDVNKRVPILGSVNCAANIISQCAPKFKSAGFSGTVLRADCVPGGSRINPDLGFVTEFWEYIVSDLKSLRSKSFGFRTKTEGLKLKKDLPSEWAVRTQNVAITLLPSSLDIHTQIFVLCFTELATRCRAVWCSRRNIGSTRSFV